MLEVLKNHVLRYQEAPDLGAYSEYHMIAASLLQSTGGAPQQATVGLVSNLGLCFRCFMARPAREFTLR